jgi:hypothetical protein
MYRYLLCCHYLGSIIFSTDQYLLFLFSNFSLPGELVVVSLVVELMEEKEVLELEGGNNFITFVDDSGDKDSTKENLSNSQSLLLCFCKALIGVTTVTLM